MIVLPFDVENFSNGFRKRIPPEVAVDEIGRALKALDPRSLLFLHHIHEVRWTLPGGETGGIRRHDLRLSRTPSARVVNLLGLDHKERWLVFERETSIKDFRQRNATIEIAFQIQGRSVVRTKNTDLVVFFPTKVRTCLGFLIQGPFKTKVSREALDEDDRSNQELIDAAAQLTADSLEKLKEFNRLNPQSFDVLPIRETDFPQESFLRPVYEAVRGALKTKPLIPTVSGSFVSGHEARLADTALLTELLSAEQLGRLFSQGPLFWIDPSVSDEFRTYLVGRKKSRYSTEWDQEPLIDGVRVETETVANRMTASFFKEEEKLDPLWLPRFYVFLNDHYLTFKDAPFVRLESEDYVSPGTLEKPNAYLRPNDTVEIDQQIFPLVCVDLMAEPTEKLLREKAKLREPDRIAAIIKCVLPKYEPGVMVFDSASYAADLQEIDRAYGDEKTSKQDRLLLIKALNEIPWVSCIQVGCQNADAVWKKPGDNVLEKSDALAHWFDQNFKVLAWFSLPVVTTHLNNEILTALGLDKNSLETQARHPELQRKSYVHSDPGFDERVTLIGIEHILAAPTVERARYLWNWMLENPAKLKGKVRTSGNAQFPEYSTKQFDGYSVVGILIKQKQWLPREQVGIYTFPHELLLKDLPEGFEKDSPRAETLARILGMKQPMDYAPFAQALGLANADDAVELAQLLRGRSMQQLRDILRDEDTDLPEGGVTNPALRQERLTEHRENAPSHESVQRERSIQPNLSEEMALARAYLRSLYGKETGHMVCQCCHDRMPFEVKDQDYFEAIQCIRGLDRHIYENRLALCPTCAARYRHARQTPDAELLRRIVSHQAPDTAPSVRIPVTLAGAEWNIHFVGKHWFDLKTLVADPAPDGGTPSAGRLSSGGSD